MRVHVRLTQFVIFIIFFGHARSSSSEEWAKGLSHIKKIDLLHGESDGSDLLLQHTILLDITRHMTMEATTLWEAIRDVYRTLIKDNQAIKDDRAKTLIRLALFTREYPSVNCYLEAGGFEAPNEVLFKGRLMSCVSYLAASNENPDTTAGPVMNALYRLIERAPEVVEPSGRHFARSIHNIIAFAGEDVSWAKIMATVAEHPAHTGNVTPNVCGLPPPPAIEIPQALETYKAFLIVVMPQELPELKDFSDKVQNPRVRLLFADVLPRTVTTPEPTTAPSVSTPLLEASKAGSGAAAPAGTPENSSLTQAVIVSTALSTHAVTVVVSPRQAAASSNGKVSRVVIISSAVGLSALALVGGINGYLIYRKYRSHSRPNVDPSSSSSATYLPAI